MRTIKKSFDFMIKAKTAPKVELTDAGLYLRFQHDVAVDQTVVQNGWPHIAIDLDVNRTVIGLEVVPVPENFTIGKIPNIFKKANVGGVPKFDPAEVEIRSLCEA